MSVAQYGCTSYLYGNDNKKCTKFCYWVEANENDTKQGKMVWHKGKWPEAKENGSETIEKDTKQGEMVWYMGKWFEA